MKIYGSDLSETSAGKNVDQPANIDLITDKLIKGLDSEKIMYKNQQKKIERLAESNRILKSELDSGEETIHISLQGTHV